LDFGLAKLTEKKLSTLRGEEESEAATAFKTAPGVIMGTPNYMSPEQAQAKPVDERTDIWSTGVMMYEMISGASPFGGTTTSHTIVSILEKEPAPLGNVPAELQRIVTKAIAKDADERYQTAKDMLIDLRSLKKRLEVQAEIDRTSSPEINVAADNADLKPQKKKVLVLAIVAMALVTAMILGLNIWRSQKPTSLTATSEPSVPIGERTLTYWITVQKFRGGQPYQKPFTQPGEMIFEQDYQIRVNIRSPQNGHLYVFNEGPAKGTTQPQFVIVFPTSTANKGLSQVEAEQVIRIPEQTWLQFDAEQGTEKLWLVFAEQPLPELEVAKGSASERARMLITDPQQNRDLQNFLNNNSLPKPISERGDGQTTLKVPGKLLVYPIKLEHH
jgi:serine/threonine protein kinase